MRDGSERPKARTGRRRPGRVPVEVLVLLAIAAVTYGRALGGCESSSPSDNGAGGGGGSIVPGGTGMTTSGGGQPMNTSSSGGGGGSACPGGLALCGSACVDLQSNPDDCGACGAVCSPSLVCMRGVCSPQAAPPEPSPAPADAALVDAPEDVTPADSTLADAPPDVVAIDASADSSDATPDAPPSDAAVACASAADCTNGWVCCSTTSVSARGSGTGPVPNLGQCMAPSTTVDYQSGFCPSGGSQLCKAGTTECPGTYFCEAPVARDGAAAPAPYCENGA